MGFRTLFLGDGRDLAPRWVFRTLFFGRGAGYSNTTGTGNSLFGGGAGTGITTGNYVVCIGNNAGPTTNVSNRLYIDVEERDDPLIYGEFDNDFVRINGTFEVTAGLSNPSSISLKENLVPVDAMVVLDKIALLDIQEWSYKDTPHVRHIGPIAEAFYAAFDLGQGSKTISTIDADGVALLAIQALRKQVDALKAENQTLRSDHLEMQRTIDALCARVAKIESSQSSLE